MSLPSFSVITPSLNQAAFIRATIDSVLGQNYPALDYQVMDGGSTDGTLDILKSYGSSLKWVSKADRGQAAAINSGWKNTQGEIVAWLNSDDLYRPDALHRVADYFSNHPEIDLVYGDCDLIDPAGRVSGRYPARPYDYLALVRSATNYIPQPAAFIRRRALEAEGMLDESLSYVMDYDFWLRIGLKGAGGYLPASLAALRLHPSAKSVAQLGKFSAELVRICQKLFARPDLPPAVRALEKEAMGMVFYRAADSSFWADQLVNGRAYAIESFRRHKRLRSLWLWLALGRAGRWMAARLYRNPYFPNQIH